MTRPTDDHILIKNVPAGHLIYCIHCGQTETVALPMEWRKWSAVTRRFQKQHRHCPPPSNGATSADDLPIAPASSPSA